MENQEMNIMDQPLSTNYQEGVKEIAELLTHIPEQVRPYLIANFVKNVSKM